jgi:hypothetical protein
MITEALRRRGINPELLDSELDPMDPRGNIIEGAEATAFFTGNARRALAKVADGVFAADRLPALQKHVQMWVDAHRRDPAEAPFLLLRGITGCGKTSQSIRALHELVLWYAGQGRRFTWYFITHREFSAAFQPNAGRDPERLMHQLMAADLVVFSDLGDANTQDFGRTQDKTSRLINHRYHHQLPTIFETNLPFYRNPNKPEQADIAVLADVIDDRAISRLNSGWKINLPQVDHRQQQGRTFNAE